MSPTFHSALMCLPDYFNVEYAINPWMKQEATVDLSQAHRQWQTLKDTIEQFLEKPVQTIKPRKKLPDMVFATDQGIVADKTFLKSNFYYRQRRAEADLYARWFAGQGYQVKTLPRECFFEGGDILAWRNILLVGHGFRTQRDSLERIAQAAGKEVIPLQLVNPWFYHLDLALLVLDEETILWYPPAFSPASRKRLGKLDVELIAVKEFDAQKFALNSLVGEKRIIVGKGINGTLDRLRERDWQICEVNVSEFLKSGGGIHCLVCQL